MSKSIGVAALVALAAGSTAVAGSNSIKLSNLFDDAKGSSLAIAAASDALGAGASVNDLGVAVRTVGGLGGNSLIAPGITFATASGGGANSAPSTVPVNDRVSAPTAMGISVDGAQLALPPNPSGKITDGIGMWGDQLLSFSLDELRTAGNFGANQGFQFTARAGLNDFAGPGGSVKVAFLVSDASGVLFGLINGVQVDVSESGGIFGFTGAQPGALTSAGNRLVNFDVFVPGEAKFITLLSLSQGDGIAEDHTVWGNASVTPAERGDIPAPGTLALGVIGAAALGRRRRA
ncbi:MAG TPA: hypothetical protein DEB06_11640 [Phycisphaerales bacterium]|nr:hypothetical protein [Phycisphaerales bacterium]